MLPNHFPSQDRPDEPERPTDELLRRLGEQKLRELQAAGMSLAQIEQKLAGAGGAPSEPGRTPTALRGPDRFGGRDALDHLTLDQRVFLRALDALDQGVLLFDRDERLVHASLPAVRLLDLDPEGERLREEIRRVVAALCVALPTAAAGLPATLPALAAEEVATPISRCRLRGSHIGLDLLGCGAMVLVILERLLPEALPDDVLRRRWKLTAKEIRVARLLAEGRSNTGIAAALSISPHTARHHTERVLAKLGVRSRGEAAARLYGIDYPDRN